MGGFVICRPKCPISGVFAVNDNKNDCCKKYQITTVVYGVDAEKVPVQVWTELRCRTKNKRKYLCAVHGAQTKYRNETVSASMYTYRK
jgi:hypothetical protein